MALRTRRSFRATEARQTHAAPAVRETRGRETSAGLASTPAPEPNPVPIVAPLVKDRIGIPLTAAGAIDFEGLRPATRDRLESALRASGLRQPTSTGSDPALLRQCEALYDALGVIAYALAQVYGYGERASVLLFTADEKLALSAPTARVLAKYPDSLKYADEITLTVTLIGVLSAKVRQLEAPSRKWTGPQPPIRDEVTVGS